MKIPSQAAAKVASRRAFSCFVVPYAKWGMDDYEPGRTIGRRAKTAERRNGTMGDGTGGCQRPP